MTKLTFDTNINVIPNSVEIQIIKTINTNPPECYKKMSDSEIKKINSDIINNPEFKKYSINLEQVKSIRSSYIKNKMIKKHGYLIAKTNSILKDYNSGLNVLQLSKKYDGSPLNIMRIILLKKNSKTKVKLFFNNPEKLNAYDYEQFIIAKDNDDFALVNQDNIQAQSLQFEKLIEQVLIHLGIKFKTQEQLVEEQIKLYGKPINTPDFLIESEFIINNRQINWIDAKNFYGSDINFVKSKIKTQTQKYLQEYGSGCIVFALGFNELYNQDKDILYMSWNTFSNFN
jgi:hypothetical protein